MQCEGLSPDAVTFACILKACVSIGAVDKGELIHEDITRQGLLGNALVDMYAKCGAPMKAQRVLEELTVRDVVSWNALIAGYAHTKENHFAENCIKVLSRMADREKMDEVLVALERRSHGGLSVSRDSMYHLLQTCIKLKDIAAIRKLHMIMVYSRLDSVLVLTDHLIRLFSLCGSLMEGILVFCRIETPSIYTWNAIISMYVSLNQGDKVSDACFEMERNGIEPDRCTFLCLLQLCATSSKRSCLVHDTIVRSGLESDNRIGNTLVHAYAGSMGLTEARKVFDGLQSKDDVSWGVMIAAYAEHGHNSVALEFFEKSLQQGFEPSKVSFLGALKACANTACTEQNKLEPYYIATSQLVHGLIMRSGLDLDLSVGNALVHMYGQCGLLADAYRVFVLLSNPDVISWGALIAGYVEHGHSVVALEFFKQAMEKGILASRVLYLHALKACGIMGAIVQGQCIHYYIVEDTLELEISIGSTLIDMYTKCGSLNEACNLFEKLPVRNAVTWGVLISGHVQNGEGLFALKLVEKMHLEGVMPSMATAVSIMKACADTGMLEQGRIEHNQLIQDGVAFDEILSCAAIDMYANCGSLEDAQFLFDKLPRRNVVSWSVMITGYAEHEKGKRALSLFEKMIQQGESPDEVIYLSVLKACRSIGALSPGRAVHDHVIISSVDSNVVVGTALIDMYAKLGQVEDAHRMCDRLPNGNVISWGALMAGYAQSGDLQMAMQCLDTMAERGLKPNHVIFSNLLVACSHFGLVKEGLWFFKTMLEAHGYATCMENYSCVLDLLSRAGHLHEASRFIHGIPMPPNPVMLTSLLTSCAMHSSIALGKQCFEQVVQENVGKASRYAFIMNTCTNSDLLEDVKEVKSTMAPLQGLR